MARLGAEWLADADADRPDPPTTDRHARATVVTAMALAVQILQPHVSRGLGQPALLPELGRHDPSTTGRWSREIRAKEKKGEGLSLAQAVQLRRMRWLVVTTEAVPLQRGRHGRAHAACSHVTHHIDVNRPCTKPLARTLTEYWRPGGTAVATV